MEDEIQYRTKLSLVTSGLKKHRSVNILVTGNSMLPALLPGSRVRIIAKNFTQIRPFDWAAMIINGKLVVHEVLFVARDYLISWGINNSHTDGKIDAEQTLGVIEKHAWENYQLVYLAEAKSIISIFKRHKINHLILKGAPWYQAKYGNLVAKLSSDIDWLINPNQYRAVDKILKSLGYHSKKIPWLSDSHYSPEVPKIGEISYVKKINDVILTIDLHLQAIRPALTLPYKQPITFENMSRLTEYFFKQKVYENHWPVLSDTDDLLYLCLNLMFHHAGLGVYQLAAISGLIERGNIDWKKLLRLSHKFNVENYLYLPLLWSMRLFKVKLPLSAFRPPIIRLLLAKFLINRWTILRAIPANKYLQSRLNMVMISYLRLVFSFGN